ncbi:RNase P protein subunit [Cavenderia fasciculata]|uniref:RNase P protein subunit n=1 Tax=Cavenderia fasciculata TaxID=261658 RepID=F4PIT5_CACFS|nr:RNase P protein subunit [Cavenderia fasciculata]EGG24664.1 RNase P protein subunit [Cavenderia fasciculata]|eukprot:XP_004362515.1 RNase P protein subunit [Cavenderia fasciculata]
MSFCDLNVPFKDVRTTSDTIDYLSQLGYGVVAITQTLRPKEANAENVLDQPVYSKQFTSSGWMKPNTNNHTMEIYKRLNIVIEKVEELKDLERSFQKKFQQYHLISITTADRMVMEAISILPWVDIINFQGNVKSRIRTEVLRKGYDKGIHYEINYNDIFKMDGSFMANTTELIRSSKGKNVIISSGCDKTRLMRSPYDIENMVSLLGMSTEHARSAHTKHAKSVILKGLTRLTHLGIIDSFPHSKLQELEKWKMINDLATNPTKNNIPEEKEKEMEKEKENQEQDVDKMKE